MTAGAGLDASTEIRRIELWKLRPSQFNPRKTFDPAALAELSESIRIHGIQVPILCRPLPVTVWRKVSEEDDELFEIIAGHRRHAALSGIEPAGDAPCIIREMTDDEAREIALIDNLQREDMPALEEADAYEALRQQLGTAEAIAGRVGKPIEYVAKRLRLVTLGENSRRALAERLITIDHALLLARLGLEDEEKALKWALDRNAGSTVKLDKIIADAIERRDRKSENRWVGYAEPETVLKLKAHIEQSSGRQLAKAPWDLDDAALIPAVGACNGCPQNTSANTSLFSDLRIEEATCADGICFESKRAAFVHIQIAAAGGPEKARRLSWKDSSVRPKMETGRPCDGPVGLNNFTSVPPTRIVLRFGQWVEAKKDSCPDVMTGVTVDWLDQSYSNKQPRKPGETLSICVTERCKVHPKSYEKKAESGSGNQGDAARKAHLEKTRLASVEENKLRIAFVAAALDAVTSVPGPALRKVLIHALPHWEDGLKPFNALIPGILNVAKTAPINSAEFAKALALSSIEDDWLEVRMDGYGAPKDGRAELIKAVRGLGFTGSDPWETTAKTAAKKAVKTPAKKAAPKKAAAKKAAKKGAAK